ncbi:hypothetical protein VTO73DRAFT_4622 [Trametes versicolor]
MAADVIVLLVTWKSSLGSIRLTTTVLKDRPSFTRMLLRDGTVYFTILLIMNTLHLTFTMLSITNDSLSQVSYFTTFTEPFTAVLVSRFLLDLQEVNQYNPNSSSSTGHTQGTSLDIAWVVGSLGSTLEPSHEAGYASSAYETELGSDGRDGLTWDDNELRILGAATNECVLKGSSASDLVHDNQTSSLALAV